MSWPQHPALREPRVLIGATILLIILLTAGFAAWVAPHDPNGQDLLKTLLPPFWKPLADPAYPLGTDALGRCILSRLLYGARIAVVVGTIVPVLATLLGCSIALLAGYCGGRVDWTVSRIVDIWMSFPPVVLSLVLMVALTPGLRNVILAMVLVDWTRFCRVTRVEILSLMRLDYMSAARIAGATHFQTVLRDLLPGVFPIMMTLFSVEIGIAIIIEAILSFVGVSVEPHIPTWGVMIADGLATVFHEPWGLVFPMGAIILTVLGANMLGDGLRLSLDPRLAERPTVATA
jgi:peptide/nickel transport system permease protein